MKSNFIRYCIAAVVSLTAISGYAQKSETIQAQAFGTATMAGRTFGVTIRIEDYSTPEDQKVLIDAFNKGGHDELVKALSKMKTKGRVGITGQLGYQVPYIRSFQTAKGRTVRIVTDRPIAIGEAYGNTRSMDYDISIIELHLNNNDKDKSTGSLIPGGRIRMNKKKKEIELETYHAMPWRLAGIMER